MENNQLNILPESITNISSLEVLNLENNPIIMLPKTHFTGSEPPEIDLTPNQKLQIIPKHLAECVCIDGIFISEKYCGIPLQSWEAKWLIEEENAEMRRLLIQVIGYEKICQQLEAVELNRWREYTLLRIDKDVDIEPIYLLKMTCPSTGYIHVLRVPPYLSSAREAIRWVNWGIDPEEFAVET